MTTISKRKGRNVVCHLSMIPGYVVIVVATKLGGVADDEDRIALTRDEICKLYEAFGTDAAEK